MDQIKEEFSITLKFDMEHLVSVERRKAKTLWVLKMKTQSVYSDYLPKQIA